MTPKIDLIKVDLSLNYYNGISSQYYLKNLDTSEVKILKGEATEKENGETGQDKALHHLL